MNLMPPTPADVLGDVADALIALASALRRLHDESPQDRGADDEELDVDEAARFIRRSKSWLRKHGRGLPGFRQPTGPGGRVRWARRALAAWRDGGAVY